MLNINMLCFSHRPSQIRVSGGAAGPQREALLPSDNVGHRQVYAHHLHPHRGPGLPAVRPYIRKAKVRQQGT